MEDHEKLEKISGRKRSTTQTGIPIIECGKCGMVHPETRKHCPVCGKPTLYPNIHCQAVAA